MDINMEIMDSKQPCFLVNNLTNMLDQCDFVAKNDCLETDSMIDYVKLIYCDIGYDYEVEAIVLLVIILIILFIGLGAAANEFLCPSLLALAKLLGMSDSVAGVTLLAFGNGCPDIFSSLAAASDNRPELIIGELLGAGIFCTSIVSGLIFISSDFPIACRPMLRDTVFYLIAAYLVWLFCWYGEIRFLWSMSFIGIYAVYLVVALFGQAIHRRQRLAETQNKTLIAPSSILSHGDKHNLGDDWSGRDIVNNKENNNNNNYSNNNNDNGIDPKKRQQQQVPKIGCHANVNANANEKQRPAASNAHGTDCSYGQGYEQGHSSRHQHEQTGKEENQIDNKLFTITKSLRNSIISPFKLSSLSEEYDGKLNVALKRYSLSDERRRSLVGSASPLHKHLENSLLAIARNDRQRRYSGQDYGSGSYGNDDELREQQGPRNRSAQTSRGSSITRITAETTLSSTTGTTSNNKGADGEKISIAIQWADGRDSRNVTNHSSIGKHGHDNYGAILLTDEHRSVIEVKGPTAIVLEDEKLSRKDLTSLSDLNEWDDFLLHICPIDVVGWSQAKIFDKMFEVARAPIYLTMLLSIPVLDYEAKRHNWCRILNALHCFTVPLAITMLTQTAHTETPLFGLPLYSAVILPGFLVAVLVVKTSEYLTPPSYHHIFAYAGFLMSIIWIYCLASEVISLLKTIGIIFSLSDAAIGLGILAWGNSLGDIVANLTLAKSGYPRMAIGACIGAPLLNLLLGFGLSFSISLGPGGKTSVQYSTMTTLLYSTITIILMALMMSTLAPPKLSKKYFGYALIIIYLVYFVVAICIEYGLTIW